MARRGERGNDGRKTAMIYYPPQILFLLRARQLRSRSSIFFPFTAHRATLRPSLHSIFLSLFFSSLDPSSDRLSLRSRPLCSAPSLKVTDCLLYYPLVSIFTLLSEALPMSIVPRGGFVRSQYGLEGLHRARIIVAVSSVSVVI